MAGFEPLCSDVGSYCSANCASIFFLQKTSLPTFNGLPQRPLSEKRTLLWKVVVQKIKLFFEFQLVAAKNSCPKGGGEKNEKMHSLAIRNFKNIFTNWKKLTQSLKKDFFQLCLNKKKFKITFCKLGWNP